MKSKIVELQNKRNMKEIKIKMHIQMMARSFSVFQRTTIHKCKPNSNKPLQIFYSEIPEENVAI